MRKWHLLTILLLVLSSAALLPWAFAQEPGSDVLFSRHRSFKIPFNLGQGASRLRQLQLFYSTDRGQTWHPSAVSAPEKPYFHFICERDGLYWFTVQTRDTQGRYYPPDIRTAKPSLKVFVDTLPPVVHLRALPPRAGQVGVAWDIRDEYMDFGDPRAIRLEYRRAGSQTWTALGINPVATHFYWDPETNAPLEVRMIVMDRAENVAEANTRVSLAGQADNSVRPVPPPPENRHSNINQGKLPAGFSGATNRRIIKSKEIRLNCEVDDVGPSGVSELELWYTTDGRSWNRYPLAKSAVKDAEPEPIDPVSANQRRRQKKRVEFSVDSEGVYGFTLIARSGVGRGQRPPQIGDPPQIWVEVDETAPVVRIDNVSVSQGIEKKDGKLTVSWSANDKNLGRNPITISYSPNLAGPWQRIVHDSANTGRYVWSMANQDVPYQFYIRVEAIDQAGNIGEDTTREMVKVDLSEPRVNILKVEPGGN